MYLQTKIMKHIAPSAVTGLDVVWKPSGLSCSAEVNLSGSGRSASEWFSKPSDSADSLQRENWVL
jgi:hypothetical protein